MKTKLAWLVASLVVIALILAGAYVWQEQQLPEELTTFEEKCGDEICDPVEKEKGLCPADCPSVTPVVTPEETTPTEETVTEKGDGVLYLGMMVHLEGWPDDTNQARFEQHAKAIEEYADLFEKYGAKLTLESKEFTDGILKWGENVLKEMEKRGHGIGVHADVGGIRIEGLTYDKFVSELREKKEILETLDVTVRHVSGICSNLDWVRAAADAGYEFTTGEVAYCASSLPIKERPEAYKNCRYAGECHQVFPSELLDRLHPWRMENGENWIEDNAKGKLVIIPSSGGLRAMYEDSLGEGTGTGVGNDFTEEDIEINIQEIEKAISLTEKDKVNTYYVSVSLGEKLDLELLEKWLQAIQPHVESGKVQWKTIPEMYDAYLNWEKENR